jgi:hypothetical protein
MPERKQPLSEAEWTRIKKAVPIVLKRKAWISADAQQYAQDCFSLVLDALWATGAHPSVFSAERAGNPQIVQDEDGFLFIHRRPKTGKALSVPINRDLAVSLAEYLPKDTGNYSRQHIWATLREFAQEAGVEGVTPRLIRHTVAIRIFREHGPSVVKETLGVSDRSLEYYTSLNDKARIAVLRSSQNPNRATATKEAA